MQKHYSADRRKVLRFATVFGERHALVGANGMKLLQNGWYN
jgi:hypothetical protein